MICPVTKKNRFCDVKFEKEITKREYETACLFPMDERVVQAYEKQEKLKVKK